MSDLKQKILEACSAASIPEGISGLWSVNKRNITNATFAKHRKKYVPVLPGTHTTLNRMTDSTMHTNGEVVMEDSIYELHTHLHFMLRARGVILVTGLGLGCVIRGLLAKPDVEHVVCIEKSKDVLKLVEPYMPKDRLTIIQADALKWTNQTGLKFDFAWHDLWTDRDAGEPHLDAWHTRLLVQCRHTCDKQGAWAYSKVLRKTCRRLNKIALI